MELGTPRPAPLSMTPYVVLTDCFMSEASRMLLPRSVSARDACRHLPADIDFFLVASDATKLHYFQNRHIYLFKILYSFHAQIELRNTPDNNPPPLTPTRFSLKKRINIKTGR